MNDKMLERLGITPKLRIKGNTRKRFSELKIGTMHALIQNAGKTNERILHCMKVDCSKEFGKPDHPEHGGYTAILQGPEPERGRIIHVPAEAAVIIVL